VSDRLVPAWSHPKTWSQQAPGSDEQAAGVDSYSAPEMKSTGEAIGIANHADNEALRKAFAASGMAHRARWALPSSPSPTPTSLSCCRLSRACPAGVVDVATEGTAKALRQAGFRHAGGEDRRGGADRARRHHAGPGQPRHQHHVEHLREPGEAGGSVFKDGFEIRARRSSGGFRA